MSWRKQLTHHVAFSAPQRRALSVLIGALGVACAVLYLLRPTSISDPPPAQGKRWADLADRIDPNTADWSELAALPSIGEKRAKAIVARRDTVKARDPRAVAFSKPEDLFYVEGFGKALVEQARPYLEFPATQPAP